MTDIFKIPSEIPPENIPVLLIYLVLMSASVVFFVFNVTRKINKWRNRDKTVTPLYYGVVYWGGDIEDSWTGIITVYEGLDFEEAKNAVIKSISKYARMENKFPAPQYYPDNEKDYNGFVALMMKDYRGIHYERNVFAITGYRSERVEPSWEGWGFSLRDPYVSYHN